MGTITGHRSILWLVGVALEWRLDWDTQCGDTGRVRNRTSVAQKQRQRHCCHDEICVDDDVARIRGPNTNRPVRAGQEQSVCRERDNSLDCGTRPGGCSNYHHHHLKIDRCESGGGQSSIWKMVRPRRQYVVHGPSRERNPRGVSHRRDCASSSSSYEYYCWLNKRWRWLSLRCCWSGWSGQSASGILSGRPRANKVARL